MPKIVRFHKTGSGDVLTFDNLDSPEPKSDEVLIHVLSVGLNRAEILFRQGLYLEKPSLPSRIGYEASGMVKAVGKNVSEFQVGDYVSTIPNFSMSKNGVWGEEAIIPHNSVVKMPESIMPDQAASVWMQYLTAYGALIDIGQLKPKQTVVITAASSSVGLAAIEIVKDANAISIATTRTQKKKQALLDAGADFVIATEEENLVKRIKEITDDKGSDITFDAIAGSIISELADAAAYEGKMFLYGALSLEKTPFPFRAALKKGLSISGYTMMQIAKNEDRLEWGKAFILSGLEKGVFKPKVDKVFKFDEISKAQDYMETNQQVGKIVVSVSS